jgi:hypothetical protein
MAPPRVIVDLAKPSVYLGVLGALQSHAFPQLHSLLSFIGQFLPLFLQPAGLSAANEDGAHHCNQNREQDFGVIFHGVSFVPNAGGS